jgi:tellurite resistance protein TerC
VFVWFAFGGRAAEEYLTAYLIEKSLSLDNLFVFLIIFQTLKIPEGKQHKVLFWGIFGAAVFRGLFISIGVRAIQRWDWISYIFGAILLYSAVRIFRKDPSKQRESRLVAWLEQHLPVTQKLQGDSFISRKEGQRAATPLLLALIAVELSDIMFAIDSVPAAFSVSRAPFILYSSNIFAILGLRSLYVVLTHVLARFRYLHYGLAGVLGLAGVKLMIGQWIDIPPLVSVGLIGLMIGAAVWASLRTGEENRDKQRGFA